LFNFKINEKLDEKLPDNIIDILNDLCIEMENICIDLFKEDTKKHPNQSGGTYIVEKKVAEDRKAIFYGNLTFQNFRFDLKLALAIDIPVGNHIYHWYYNPTFGRFTCFNKLFRINELLTLFKYESLDDFAALLNSVRLKLV